MLGSSLLLLALATLASAQTIVNGCLRLEGSVACPGFNNAWLSPGNLSNAFPFMGSVSDVASFDAGALNYFSDPNQYRQTKFVDQLGCTNSSTAMLRYARTVLCSMWVNEQWSVQCLNLYNASQIATGPKMVCQSTCIEYAESENSVVQNATYCPGPDLTGGFRQGNLTKDFVQCTNWTSLATANTSTCVLGANNEGQCGFGSSTRQLCNFCNTAQPDDCCYASNTDITPCGFVLPVRPSSSSSSASATSSSSPSSSVASTSNAARSGLSKGQLAGIIVGSVIGGLLLIGALIALLFCCGCLGAGRRKRRNGQLSPASTGLVSNGSPQADMSEVSGANASILGGAGMGAASSGRTMVPGGGSSYGGSADKLGKFGAAAGAVGAAGAGRALLNHVRDENQSTEQLITPNSRVTVLWPYTAALPDELTLRPGMKLTVLRIYDDGWATGVVTDGDDGERGKQGAYPTVCVTVDRGTPNSGEANSPISRNSGSEGHWQSSQGQSSGP